jgi:hypothetical protein
MLGLEQGKEEMIVSITPEEIERVRIFAIKVGENKRNNKVFDMRYNTNKSSEETDFDGFLAEFAVRKLLGIEFVEEFFEKDDGGIDIVYKGRTWQVKWCNYRFDGHFFINSNKELLADVGVLVIPTGDENILNVRGWISRERFYNELKEQREHGIESDFGYGRRKAVHMSKLDKMELLLS